LLRKAYDGRNNTTNVELWHEVFYHSEYRKTIFKHVPNPTWGVRRACNFAVVADKTKKSIGCAVLFASGWVENVSYKSITTANVNALNHLAL
jgi:hypothetical protein